MAIDPVCGMRVDEKSKLTVTHSKVKYYFCSTSCQQAFKANPLHYIGGKASSKHQANQSDSDEKAKDPICGMVVSKSSPLKSERAGRTYYFCSEGCKRTFEYPETELKSMKTRVMIAMTGVLALAIMRAGAFLALATGATIVTWVPIPALPWFTWGGMVVFASDTCAIYWWMGVL